ncbi:hypothetical protein FH972_007125 [Carpinus fangiana]|uniref:PGG domain-containing protein n=1 Tax=Carpinus fangiana TaxID=176857 RepID=A0A5N6QXN6_9ROSI|nr:hypothetical protein FH972_007125 [Carpinus fangiana]
MDRRQDEEENMVTVYEASLNGCVITLNGLIQRDPLLLNKISLTSLSDTPLHIAALLGHLQFCKVLVNKNPKLVEEVDSRGRTPLHLASAAGHIDLVKALLQANANVCLARDQDGRIPLHLASMRGRIDIIEELINARPESIQVNLEGDSVLHLCVQYNHLHALKLLVVLAKCEEFFLSSEDHDGNSILHLAVMLKQTKAVKYILSIPEIKTKVNARNKIGYTALDVLEVSPRDFKSFEIQNILKEAGVRRSTDLNSSLPMTPSALEAQPTQSKRPTQSRFRRWWGKVRSFLVKHWNHQGNWMEETRGTLMVVATVMATMAFQAGISPPGGVWQQDTSDPMAGSQCSKDVICEAGTAVLSYAYSSTYLLFLYFNTTSFFASLCVILLVITGYPLRSKFFIWLLTLAMIISVAFMTLTYIYAVILVTPDHLIDKVSSLALKLVYIWVGMVLIAGVIHIIRLLYWMVKKFIHLIRILYSMVKKLRNFIRKSTRGPAEDTTNV